jgi:hypothetical protein
MSTLILPYKSLTLDDFLKTNTKIPNNIPYNLLPNIIRCVKEILIPLDIHFINYPFPYYISSCYRSPKVNEAVGGAISSDHLQALALDLAAKPHHISKLYDWAITMPFRYVKRYYKHVHISLKI